MKKMFSLAPRWKRWVSKLITATALGAMLGSGVMTVNAVGTPVFNSLQGQGDQPTLQVDNNSGGWATSTSKKVGQEASFLVWVHNTEPDTTAHNVRVKIALPTDQSLWHSVTATISADNASSVQGQATINVDGNSTISYKPGSAQLFSTQTTTNPDGTTSSNLVPVGWGSGVNGDSVVTSGVNLGDQQGCFQFVQAVRITVVINGISTPTPTPGTPAIKTNKEVQLADGPAFSGSAKAKPGDYINYQIYLENTGTATGVNPTITDTLDSKFSYVPNTSYAIFKNNGTDYRQVIPDSNIKGLGTQTLTWAFTDMPNQPDKAIYLNFQVKIAGADQFTTGDTTLQNCATTDFTGIPAVQTNCVTVVVSKTAQPVITFTLRKEVTNMTSADGKWYDGQLAAAKPGDTIGYRLTIVNDGNTPATNVTLKDILPSILKFNNDVKMYSNDNKNGVTVSGSELVNGGLVIPTITNGNIGYQQFTFSAVVPNQCSQQTVDNVAQVIFNGTVQVEAKASFNFTCTQGLVITKTIQDPQTKEFKSSIGNVHEGQVLTYRVDVQNTGNSPITSAVVRDALSDQVTYVAGSLTQDGQSVSQTIEDAFFHNGYTLSTLGGTNAAGKEIMFQVKVKECPNGDSTLTNTATARADGIPEVSSAATAHIHVVAPALTL